MTILIVDEPAARQTIRGFLLARRDSRGWCIREARSGEDAIRIYEKERARIDLVISEFDLPGMSGQALLHAIRGGFAHLGSKLTAFLLLTTDLHLGQVRDLRRSIPRFDACLAKPFRRTELSAAIRNAMRRRGAARDALLYIGNISDELLRVRTAMRLHRNHWSRLFHGSTVAELDDCVRVADHSVGGVLVDPDVYAGLAEDWLARFRRSRVGARASVLCLGRMPERIGLLRRHCDLFFEPAAADWEWIQWLHVMSIRVSRSDELAQLATAATRLKKQGRDWKAVAAAYALLRRDASSSRASSDLAEVFRRRGFARAAASYARRAVELNPCSPRAHYLMIELAQGAAEREAAAASARAFCPRLPELVARASSPGVLCGDRPDGHSQSGGRVRERVQFLPLPLPRLSLRARE